jgi:hypothetical protein
MDPLLLRFIERMAVVCIGGMSIYLGYRLFISVPTQRDSAGKLALPWNISIILNRVGPGVFFALFGVAAVSLSLLQPLQIGAAGEPGAISYAGAAPLHASARQRSERADQRALLRRDFALLNNLPNSELAAARIKLKLLAPLWGAAEEGFGDFNAFVAWANGERREVPADSPAALALWRYGAPEPE